MSIWRVRPAQAGDAPVVVALEALAFGPASWGEKGVADGFAERNVFVILAEPADEASAAGFAFWRCAGEEAEILSIGVAPADRRKGCGKALLEVIVAAAREAGVRRLFLEVDIGNPSAAALYRARGFEPVGRRKRYYRSGGDALVMRLDL